MVRALVLLLSLGVLASGCVQAKKNPISVGASPIVKEYQIEARQFGFSPNEIRVPAGTRVRLAVTSADVDHQLAVLGIGPEKNAIQGRRQTMEMVAWPPGTYAIVCVVPCGTGHERMQGLLVVE